ncbi:MAG: hypothetical protein EBR33_11060 [Synechococcaceae bacterium WB4_1_0192]|nr:hypothetical protein [Synechococcaceae bacterium WB4_1_0192]
MNKIKVALIASAAAGAVVVGALATAVIVVVNAKREPMLYSCGAGKDVEYVLASGPEYMIVNPGRDWGRNSFLISNEAGAIPRNWLYLGIPIRAVGADGFTLAATESRPFIKTITFDVKTRSLAIQYGVQAKRREVLTCKPSADLARVQAAANNVPVEYILARKSALPFLNPSLGQRQFNLSLYNAIRSKKNSTYAVYQLLAGVPGSQLTGDESLVMADARKELIKANSSQMSLWEFAGTYRYSWEFANEQGEANLNAGNWCRNQSSGTLSEYTSSGYKVTSQSPEIRSTNGWVRQDYPDGRFSGYVKYQAQCDGTFYSLVKEGSVDNELENSYDYYD